MESVFTRVINGELPGRFVWKDELCVAFLSIAPLRPGHTLVVPRQQVDHWLDLEPDLAAHLMLVSQSIGKGIQRGFRPTRVGMMIVGLEVPHVHIHLTPIDSPHDMDFGRQQQNPDPADMEDAARTIRTALTELGYSQAVVSEDS